MAVGTTEGEGGAEVVGVVGEAALLAVAEAPLEDAEAPLEDVAAPPETDTEGAGGRRGTEVGAEGTAVTAAATGAAIAAGSEAVTEAGAGADSAARPESKGGRSHIPSRARGAASSLSTASSSLAFPRIWTRVWLIIRRTRWSLLFAR